MRPNFRLLSLVLAETFLWTTLATDLSFAFESPREHLRPQAARFDRVGQIETALDGGRHSYLTDPDYLFLEPLVGHPQSEANPKEVQRRALQLKKKFGNEPEVERALALLNRERNIQIPIFEDYRVNGDRVHFHPVEDVLDTPDKIRAFFEGKTILIIEEHHDDAALNLTALLTQFPTLTARGVLVTVTQDVEGVSDEYFKQRTGEELPVLMSEDELREVDGRKARIREEEGTTYADDMGIDMRNYHRLADRVPVQQAVSKVDPIKGGGKRFLSYYTRFRPLDGRTRGQLRQLLSDVRPDIVVTHLPYASYHPTHRDTVRAVLAAVVANQKQTDHLPQFLFFPDVEDTFTAYGLSPNVIHFYTGRRSEIKAKLLKDAYPSQFARNPDLADVILERDRLAALEEKEKLSERGQVEMLPENPYAERFLLVNLRIQPAGNKAHDGGVRDFEQIRDLIYRGELDRSAQRMEELFQPAAGRISETRTQYYETLAWVLGELWVLDEERSVSFLTKLVEKNLPTQTPRVRGLREKEIFRLKAKGVYAQDWKTIRVGRAFQTRNIGPGTVLLGKIFIEGGTKSNMIYRSILNQVALGRDAQIRSASATWTVLEERASLLPKATARGAGGANPADRTYNVIRIKRNARVEGNSLLETTSQRISWTPHPEGALKDKRVEATPTVIETDAVVIDSYVHNSRIGEGSRVLGGYVEHARLRPRTWVYWADPNQGIRSRIVLSDVGGKIASDQVIFTVVDYLISEPGLSFTSMIGVDRLVVDNEEIQYPVVFAQRKESIVANWNGAGDPTLTEMEKGEIFIHPGVVIGEKASLYTGKGTSSKESFREALAEIRATAIRPISTVSGGGEVVGSSPGFSRIIGIKPIESELGVYLEDFHLLVNTIVTMQRLMEEAGKPWTSRHDKIPQVWAAQEMETFRQMLESPGEQRSDHVRRLRRSIELYERAIRRLEMKNGRFLDPKLAEIQETAPGFEAFVFGGEKQSPEEQAGPVLHNPFFQAGIETPEAENILRRARSTFHPLSAEGLQVLRDRGVKIAKGTRIFAEKGFSTDTVQEGAFLAGELFLGREVEEIKGTVIDAVVLGGRIVKGALVVGSVVPTRKGQSVAGEVVYSFVGPTNIPSHARLEWSDCSDCLFFGEEGSEPIQLIHTSITGADIYPGQRSFYSQVKTNPGLPPFRPDIDEITRDIRVEEGHPLYDFYVTDREAIARTFRDLLGEDGTVDVKRTVLGTNSLLIHAGHVENVSVGRGAVVKAPIRLRQILIGEGAQIRANTVAQNGVVGAGAVAGATLQKFILAPGAANGHSSSIATDFYTLMYVPVFFPKSEYPSGKLPAGLKVVRETPNGYHGLFSLKRSQVNIGGGTIATKVVLSDGVFSRINAEVRQERQFIFAGLNSFLSGSQLSNPVIISHASDHGDLSYELDNPERIVWKGIHSGIDYGALMEGGLWRDIAYHKALHDPHRYAKAIQTREAVLRSRAFETEMDGEGRAHFVDPWRKVAWKDRVLLANDRWLRYLKERSASDGGGRFERPTEPERFARDGGKKRSLEETTALQRYFAELKQEAYQWKGRDDRALFSRLKNKKRRMREAGRIELIESHLRYVVKIAAAYRNLGLPFDDLIQEGNVGLLEAADRYNPDKGTKFTTYAVWWIRKSILRALTDKVDPVRIPSYQRKKVTFLLGQIEALRQELNTDPDLSLVAQRLGKELRKVEEILSYKGRFVSLDQPLNREDPTAGTVGDRFRATLPSPEETAAFSEEVEALYRNLQTLSDQEKKVLKERFGFGDIPRTLKEVGEKMKLSRERIRQIERKALQRLRVKRQARDGGKISLEGYTIPDYAIERREIPAQLDAIVAVHRHLTKNLKREPTKEEFAEAFGWDPNHPERFERGPERWVENINFYLTIARQQGVAGLPSHLSFSTQYQVVQLEKRRSHEASEREARAKVVPVAKPSVPPPSAKPAPPAQLPEPAPERAVVVLKEINFYPASVRDAVTKARRSSQIGDYANAWAFYQQAVETVTESGAEPGVLRQLKEEAGAQQSFAEAMESGQELYERALALAEQGEAKEASGFFGEARESFEAAQALFPDHASVRGAMTRVGDSLESLALEEGTKKVDRTDAQAPDEIDNIDIIEENIRAFSEPLSVFLIGGNAFEGVTPEEQRENMVVMLEKTIPAIRKGRRVLIVPGSGPQVGEALAELHKGSPRPLRELLGKEVEPKVMEGANRLAEERTGEAMEQILKQLLRETGIKRSISFVKTRVLVNPNDPAFSHPSKPIGPKTDRLATVASPKPLAVDRIDTISSLLQEGVIVIAGVGGGVPVDEKGNPVSAVVGKDHTGSFLARELGADELRIFTHGKRPPFLQKEVTVSQLGPILKQLKKDRSLDAGGLEKLTAVYQFVKETGKPAMIESGRGQTTRIVPDPLKRATAKDGGSENALTLAFAYPDATSYEVVIDEVTGATLRDLLKPEGPSLEERLIQRERHRLTTELLEAFVLEPAFRYVPRKGLVEIPTKDKEKYARILRLRNGVEGDKDWTLQEIGHAMSLSRERIRQLEAEAKRFIANFARRNRKRFGTLFSADGGKETHVLNDLPQISERVWELLNDEKFGEAVNVLEEIREALPLREDKPRSRLRRMQSFIEHVEISLNAARELRQEGDQAVTEGRSKEGRTLYARAMQMLRTAQRPLPDGAPLKEKLAVEAQEVSSRHVVAKKTEDVIKTPEVPDLSVVAEQLRQDAYEQLEATIYTAWRKGDFVKVRGLLAHMKLQYKGTPFWRPKFYDRYARLAGVRSENSSSDGGSLIRVSALLSVESAAPLTVERKPAVLLPQFP